MEKIELGNATLYCGDCLDILPTLPDNSVDAVVTDPPYGLSFMGKHWDYDVPGVDVWRECLRVLKPGGHLLAFAGTRTQHRMAVNIEDAGFDIRDMIAWVYGSGFPKSHNLKREWDGWGTALKPALEPITVARKPFCGSVAQNVAEHGAGALNIDGCRVATTDVIHAPQSDPSKRAGVVGTNLGISNSDVGDFQAAQRASIQRTMNLGRWPANLIHDGSKEVVECFPETISKYGTQKSDTTRKWLGVNGFGGDARETNKFKGDSGSAARFFYCAKASKPDRGDRNGHPTVKPSDLMRYLCRLVTPPGGVVLDPFAGSGSTGKAAALEGFRFIGIEREAEYIEIAKARIEAAQRQQRLAI